MTLVEDIFQIVNLGSISTSVLLGLLIGAFYGFNLDPDAPPIYPSALWLVGILFIVVFGITGAFSGFGLTWGFQIARALLWTLTCAAIPIGRYGRWRLTHRGK